eukprot:scaffold15089_cov168-Amphora_coffeaeformis.AAC.13
MPIVHFSAYSNSTYPPLKRDWWLLVVGARSKKAAVPDSRFNECTSVPLRARRQLTLTTISVLKQQTRDNVLQRKRRGHRNLPLFDRCCRNSLKGSGYWERGCKFARYANSNQALRR